MLILDTQNSQWTNRLKAHSPIHVDPEQRQYTIYHLTALSEKEKVRDRTQKVDGSDQGMEFRNQRDLALERAKSSRNAAEPAPEKTYVQQLKDSGMAPQWQDRQAAAPAANSGTSAAQAEISSAAKALWQQYVALLAGRAVGPLPISVINAVASYTSSKQAIAA